MRKYAAAGATALYAGLGLVRQAHAAESELEAGKKVGPPQPRRLLSRTQLSAADASHNILRLRFSMGTDAPLGVSGPEYHVRVRDVI